MTAKVLPFPARRAAQRIRSALATLLAGKPGADELLAGPLDLPADPMRQEGVALELEAMAVMSQAKDDGDPA